jgi:2,3-diketo-5-methylthio-1-phosphopentane phosphatase
MAPKTSLVVVLDFDGTVTLKDIGDELCTRFAPPEWKQLDDQWVNGTLSLPEAQRRMWSLMRASRDEAVSHAHATGTLRPGLDALIDAVARSDGELWLASGGFDFYVEALLGERLSRFSRAWYNRARFVDGRVAIEFPHHALACERVAVCKGRICDQARTLAERVWFVGDGASDRCAIGHAERLFAVDAGLLARACDAEAAAYTPFTSFADVARMLG